MAKVVVVMFDSRREAEDAAQDLMDAGFAQSEIDIRSKESTTAAADDTRRAETTSWWDWLFGESDDRAYYKEGMDRGGAVLTVTTSEERADRARMVFAELGETVEPSAPTVSGIEAQPPRSSSSHRDQADVIPVVEERLRVGKRQVQGGTVHVYTRVIDRPVEEDVRLREERVRLERRPADRAVEATDDAFRERVIELTESAEEVVVGKEARVVEEVIVGREVSERVETVRDSVRHTEVDLETAGRPHEEFRGHWTANFQTTGRPYEEYVPAYSYGRQLREDPRYGNREWASVESDARRDWEERSPGTWDSFKESIRHAWENARGAKPRAA